MKPRHIAMGAALVVAAALVLFGDRTPSGGVVESVDRAPAARSAKPAAQTTVAAQPAAAAPGAATPPPTAAAAQPAAAAPGAATPPPTAAAASPAGRPGAAGAAPAARPAVAAGGAGSAAAGPVASAPAILALIARSELIGDAGEGAFKSADGVFGGQTWNPPPPPAPPPAPPPPPPPPPPPTAPPLPFQVIGKAIADGQWEVFLSRGPDQTYVVRKSTVIDGMYRIETIAPPTMTITYLPMNQVQQLNIGVIE